MKITKEKTLYIGAGLIILNNLLQYIEPIIFQTTYLIWFSSLKEGLQWS